MFYIIHTFEGRPSMSPLCPYLSCFSYYLCRMDDSTFKYSLPQINSRIISPIPLNPGLKTRSGGVSIPHFLVAVALVVVFISTGCKSNCHNRGRKANYLLCQLSWFYIHNSRRQHRSFFNRRVTTGKRN